MTAVLMVARAELRRRRGSVLILVLMVALVLGVVLTAAAGARRTSGVLDRFAEGTGMADVQVGLARPRVASDSATVLEVADELAALDGVDEVVPMQGLPVIGETELDMFLMTGPDARYLDSRTPFLLEGRMPAVDVSTEVALNEGAARELGLTTGSTLLVPTVSLETAEALFDGELDEFVTDGPELEFNVVGIYRDSGSFDVVVPPMGILSPGVSSRFGDVAAFTVFFELAGDTPIEIDRAFSILQTQAPDAEVFGSYRHEELNPVRTAFDSIATGLVLFAAVAAAAGFIALGQVVARHVALSDRVVPEVRALGMSRWAAAVALAIPAAVAGVVGSVVGVGAAVLLSSRFPISVARLAEIDPGIRVDWTVLVVGAVVSVVALAGLSLASAWTQTRSLAGEARPRRVGWTRARRSLPPTAALGFGAVVSGRSGRGVYAGSAVAGAVLGIAGILGVAVFATSQQAAQADASRFGWTWDVSPDMFAEDPMPLVEDLAADPRIAAVGGVYCDPLRLEGQIELGCALLVVSGPLEFMYLDGRAPASPTEVALGRATMEKYGVGIGDAVDVSGESGLSAELVVVGAVVVPTQSEEAGHGLVLSPEAFENLADEFYDRDLVLSYEAGLDQEALAVELAEEYPVEFNIYSYPEVPSSLSQLRRMRPTLVALAVFMGVLGVVGLGHYLLLSTRRRRGEIAVMKALGFVRRQVRAVVAWQAAIVALIGVIIGVPLGVIVGRWAWVAAVDQIGIVDTPTMPWMAGAIVALVAVGGASALAVIPGWWAARRSPADALWTE